MDILCDRCGRKTHDGEIDKEEMNLCDKCVDVLTDYVYREQERVTKEAVEYFMNNECSRRLKRIGD